MTVELRCEQGHYRLRAEGTAFRCVCRKGDEVICLLQQLSFVRYGAVLPNGDIALATVKSPY